MTRTQYAIVACILPRLSDEDLASLLAETDHIEAQRHTALGAIIALLPRLSDLDLVHLRELAELVINERLEVARQAEGIHAPE